MKRKEFLQTVCSKLTHHHFCSRVSYEITQDYYGIVKSVIFTYECDICGKRILSNTPLKGEKLWTR